MSRLLIASFKVESGRIMASDPCYRIGTWCQNSIPARNGKYEVYLTRKESGCWGERNWKLEVIHEDFTHFKADELDWEMVGGRFGVDSGTFGFFDYDYYAKCHDEEDMDTFDEWYDIKVCSAINDFWNVCDGRGVWSSSGFGDGSYDVDAVWDGDEVVALQATFIYEDEEDE